MSTFTATASDGKTHVRRSATKSYPVALLQSAPDGLGFTRAFFYSDADVAAARLRGLLATLPAGWASELVETIQS